MTWTVPWHICEHAWFTCVPWRVHMRGVTHSHVWHDSLVYVDSTPRTCHTCECLWILLEHCQHFLYVLTFFVCIRVCSTFVVCVCMCWQYSKKLEELENERKKLEDDKSQVDRKCVAVCCSVLQRVAACCSVLQSSKKLEDNKSQFDHKCVAVCCSVLQRVAACCSVLPCVAVPQKTWGRWKSQVDRKWVAACCSMLQSSKKCEDD